MLEPETVRDLTAEEVAAGLEAGNMLLVDVREPQETAVERIAGSVLLPLSRFDPDDILAARSRSCARCGISVRCSLGWRTEILEGGWFSHRTVI